MKEITLVVFDDDLPIFENTDKLFESFGQICMAKSVYENIRLVATLNNKSVPDFIKELVKNI